MKNRCFSFGGLTLAVEGEWLPTEIGNCAAPFLVPHRAADASVRIFLRDELQIPEGKPIFENYTSRVLDDGERIYLCRRNDHRAENGEYALVTYAKSCPDHMQLHFRAGGCTPSFDAILSTIMIESLLLRHKRAVFHASWVDVQGEALLFSGASGAGKSTQAELWRNHRGAETINGDKVLLWNGMAHGLPFAGTSGICRNRTQPLRAVVMLRHGKENRLRQLRGADAVKAVLSQIPVQKWNPADIERAMDAAVELVKTAPVYEFFCLPEKSAVSYLEQIL